ncbi:hypothetical protein CEE78_12495, partial [Lactobacillus crispatus]
GGVGSGRGMPERGAGRGGGCGCLCDKEAGTAENNARARDGSVRGVEETDRGLLGGVQHGAGRGQRDGGVCAVDHRRQRHGVGAGLFD